MGTHRLLGPAGVRNLALLRASGTWITSVDDDDRLPPGSLDIRLQALLQHQVPWVAGTLTHRYADGRENVWACPTPLGLRKPGDVFRAWPEASGTVPLGPTTLLVAADLLSAVGGWQGLPQGEDLGMVMGLTGIAPGFMLPDSVYYYNQHEGQSVRQEGFEVLEATVRQIAWRRGAVLAKNPMLWTR